MEYSLRTFNNNTQNVVVMRHGDRIDNFEPLWLSNATRPWDPPLIQDGLVRAYQTGQIIRSQIGFPIHRIFVSPFLRCIQTAMEVVSALSDVVLDDNDVSSIDKSNLKVSVEFGLCKMINRVGIKPDVAPKDGNFGFKISNLESMFPHLMLDPNVHKVYKEVPKWGESGEECRERFLHTVKDLADKYPNENLLFVTHWVGISSALCNLFNEEKRYKIEYCGFIGLGRQFGSNEFEVITTTHGVKEHVSRTNKTQPSPIRDLIITQTPSPV